MTLKFRVLCPFFPLCTSLPPYLSLSFSLCRYRGPLMFIYIMNNVEVCSAGQWTVGSVRNMLSEEPSCSVILWTMFICVQQDNEQLASSRISSLENLYVWWYYEQCSGVFSRTMNSWHGQEYPVWRIWCSATGINSMQTLGILCARSQFIRNIVHIQLCLSVCH